MGGSGVERLMARVARRRGPALLLAILVPVTFACSRRADMQESPRSASASAALERLRTMKIFFGHQSVGGDIVAGIEDLLSAQEYPATRVVETARPEDFSAAPLFAHAGVGTNADPVSKIEDFERIVTNGVGGAADVAFFKFCYIDLGADDDPGALFERYRAAMERLQSAFPSTRLAHVTIPLRVVQTGPRAWVKKVIGRPIGGYAENIVRTRYNALLRSAYRGKAPLFDLALVESTGRDAARCTFEAGGQRYEALCPEYTTDGGHLNRDGRRVVARELVEFLGSLAGHRS